MSFIIRVPSADWSGKGFPNINPFVAVEDMKYGFDFRPRTGRLVDLSGNTTITPKRVDQVGGVLNVTDPTIITETADGLGIVLTLGYLQSSEELAPIPLNGSVQFTRMVVGGWSGIAFPPEKVSGSSPDTASLLDYGTNVGGAGYRIIREGQNPGSATSCSDVESTGMDALLKTPTGTYGMANPQRQCAVFLTFNGSSWKMWNKTLGLSQGKTNAELNVSGTIAVTGAYTGGKLSLGGHFHQTSTIFAGIPSIYQQAAWDRVLTDEEIEDQYRRTAAAFASVGV